MVRFECFGLRWYLLANFRDQSFEAFVRVTAKLAFPYHDHIPASRLQSGMHARVAFSVCLEFRLPAFGIGCRHGRVAAAEVTMPEASMNENGGPISRKGYVG